MRHLVSCRSGDFANDLPIRLGVAWRIDGFANALNAAVAIGEDTIFFREAGSWKNDVGESSRFVMENFLADHELALVQTFFNLRNVWLGDVYKRQAVAMP